jgi:predicted MPP superfamily phosphohydrolase
MGFLLQKKIQIWRAGLNQRQGDGSFNRRDFRVENHSIAISGLNPAFWGYRLVHISDIHLGQWLTAERLEGVVDLINQQSPDMVAITGDFFSYVLDSEAEGLARALKRLSHADATVAVLGNHDHWLGADEVRGVLRRCGIIDLSNDVFTLARNDAALHIAGLDDVMVDMHRLDLVMERLPPFGPAVLLVHEPDFAEISARTGRFALQLSGHSHGGQIVLPRLGTPIRAKHFRRYPLGRYQVGDMVQYTSRGLGTNLFWSRINCPPEIAVFTLHAGEEA